MLSLPLTSGNKITIFGKNISVLRDAKNIYPNTDDGVIKSIEIVRLEDGTHGNGGWTIDLPYERVIELVQKHIKEVA